jgi:hypothetical protein
VYRNSGTADLVTLSNSDGVSTSVRIDGCTLNVIGSTGALISSSVRFLRVGTTDFYNGAKSLNVTGGLTQVVLSNCETVSNSSEIISVSSGATVAISSCLVRNLGTNASGINIAGGGTALVTTSTLFDVSSGTGYCVQGSGTVIYDFISFNDIPIVQPRNRKFQSSLSIVALPTTPNVVA